MGWIKPEGGWFLDPLAEPRSASRYPGRAAAPLTAASAVSDLDDLDISASLMDRPVFASRCSFSEIGARGAFRGAVKPSASIIPALTQRGGILCYLRTSQCF